MVSKRAPTFSHTSDYSNYLSTIMDNSMSQLVDMSNEFKQEVTQTRELRRDKTVEEEIDSKKQHEAIRRHRHKFWANAVTSCPNLLVVWMAEHLHDVCGDPLEEFGQWLKEQHSVVQAGIEDAKRIDTDE